MSDSISTEIYVAFHSARRSLNKYTITTIRLFLYYYFFVASFDLTKLLKWKTRIHGKRITKKKVLWKRTNRNNEFSKYMYIYILVFVLTIKFCKITFPSPPKIKKKKIRSRFSFSSSTKTNDDLNCELCWLKYLSFLVGLSDWLYLFFAFKTLLTTMIF